MSDGIRKMFDSIKNAISKGERVCSCLLNYYPGIQADIYQVESRGYKIELMSHPAVGHVWVRIEIGAT